MKIRTEQRATVAPELQQEQTLNLWQTKSIHRYKFDIKKYVETLEVPEPQQEQTVDWMCSQVGTPKTDVLKVLVIGPGSGRLEIPFIEKLGALHPNKKIEAVFVDYSKFSLQELKNELATRQGNGKEKYGLKLGDLNRTSWISADGYLDYEIVEEDFEDWCKSWDATVNEDSAKTKPVEWDVIVAFFVINFFEDWLAGLKKILAHLKPDGSFFFSEDTDDIRFLDNSFDPIRDQELLNQLNGTEEVPNRATFYRFWRKYYDEREKAGYPWQPLISPSDMSLVVRILQRLDDLKLGAYTSTKVTWTSELRLAHWIKIIERAEVFHCLSVIPEKLSKELAQTLKDWLNERFEGALNYRLRIKLGHSISCYKRFPEQHFTRTDKSEIENQLQRARDAHLNSIGYVVESEYEKALFKSLALAKPYLLDLSAPETKLENHISRVMATRNQLPLRGKAAFSVVSWKLDDLSDPSRGGWSRDVPILFPEQYNKDDDHSFCISYALYMCKRNYEKVADQHLPLISDILIHKLPVNLRFEFRVDTEDSASIKFDKTGAPSTLLLKLKESHVELIRSAARNIIQPLVGAEGDPWRPGKHRTKTKHFDFKRLPLVSFDEVINFADAIWKTSENSTNAVKRLFNLIDDLSKKLEKEIEIQLGTIGKHKAEWEITELSGIAASLAKIAYANTIIGANTRHPWTIASFLPAKSILQYLKRNNNYWEVGLLGFICYYHPEEGEILGRPPQDSKHEPGYLALMRDLLCINVNQFGLQDAIHQYGKLVRQEAGRSATAAIMSRNMSHNIGSHVLASSDLMSGVHKIEVQKLHNFLQQRMDFIAQVVTYTPSWGEPLFFFKDLLQGFFDQYLLLSHLIKDQGYKDIVFKISINRDRTLTFVRDPILRCRNESCQKLKTSDNPLKVCRCAFSKITKGANVWGECGSWVLQEDCETDNPGANKKLDDFLVSIPGGAIGAHAFYDILENSIRNSAKYGVKQSVFTLHIDVDPDDERYLLNVWDESSIIKHNPDTTVDIRHKSENCECRLCRVRRRLDESLVNPQTGAIEVQSRGVHEMKECAKLLAFPYPTDPDPQSQQAKSWDVLKFDLNMPPPGNNKSQKSSGKPSPIRRQLWADAEKPKGKYLSLKFFLQKPRLIGVADLREKSKAKITRAGESCGVFTYSEIKDLSEHSHQLAIVFLPRQTDQWNKIFDELVKHQHQLPYRLLLVSNHQAECEVRIAQETQRFSAVKNSDGSGSGFPRRRMYHCSFEDVHYPDIKSQWENFAIRAYEAWLRGFKNIGNGQKYHLVIAFEREPGHSAFASWQAGLEHFHSNILDVHIMRVWSTESQWRFTIAASNAPNMNEADLKLDIRNKPNSYVVIDNHGNGQNALEVEFLTKLGSYQAFGSDNLKFYHALESPPPSGFLFNFFVLSVLEAALTKVVIVDERVAEAIYDESKGFRRPLSGREGGYALNALERAGCYTIFTMRTDKSKNEPVFISDALKKTDEVVKEISSDEGLDLREVGNRGVNAQFYSEHGALELKPLREIDFVIIHQGVIDKLDNSRDWNESDLNILYDYAPSIVITSGRGRTLRNVPSETPFIEFATVRENTYAGLSKYHLVRACLSVVGTKVRD